jgi:diacylglycerol kinase
VKHIRALARGFGYAFHGIGYAVRTQRNLRIHLNAVALVILVGWMARLEPWQWAAVTLCCGVVLAMELLNTAVEVLCDRVTRERDPAIGHAKDAAAGAVLVTAMAAVLVAVAVLLDGPWKTLLETLRNSTWKAVLLAVALAASAVHVLWLSALGTGKGT